MAIFTSGIDRTLPNLTQAYQVDTENPAEVEYFMAHLVEMNDWRITQLSAEERARMVAEFTKMCRLTQSVMATLHDEGGISAHEINEIEEFFENFYTGIKMPAGDLRRDSKGKRLILPVGKIVEVSRFKDDALIPASVLFGFIRALYREIKAGEGTLRRCVECQSVFIERRAGQQFCSYRCSGRVRMRRRRAAPQENALVTGRV